MTTSFSVPLPQLEPLPLLLRATIDHSYLDRMGHMNVRHYLGLFDDAALHFFESFGMDETYFSTYDAGGFALQHFIRYLAEVREEDTLHIRGRMLARSAKRIHTMYFMVNETRDVLAATLEGLGSHADLVTRRTSPFPEFMAAKIDALLAAHTTLDWQAPVSGVFKV